MGLPKLESIDGAYQSRPPSRRPGRCQSSRLGWWCCRQSGRCRWPSRSAHTCRCRPGTLCASTPIEGTAMSSVIRAVGWAPGTHPSTVLCWQCRRWLRCTRPRCKRTQCCCSADSAGSCTPGTLVRVRPSRGDPFSASACSAGQEGHERARTRAWLTIADEALRCQAVAVVASSDGGVAARRARARDLACLAVRETAGGDACARCAAARRVAGAERVGRAPVGGSMSTKSIGCA